MTISSCKEQNSAQPRNSPSSNLKYFPWNPWPGWAEGWVLWVINEAVIYGLVWLWLLGIDNCLHNLPLPPSSERILSLLLDECENQRWIMLTYGETVNQNALPRAVLRWKGRLLKQGKQKGNCLLMPSVGAIWVSPESGHFRNAGRVDLCTEVLIVGHLPESYWWQQWVQWYTYTMLTTPQW